MPNLLPKTLEDAVCFNEVRNMFGYTGTYKGHRVSVMGTEWEFRPFLSMRMN